MDLNRLSELDRLGRFPPRATEELARRSQELRLPQAEQLDWDTLRDDYHNHSLDLDQQQWSHFEQLTAEAWNTRRQLERKLKGSPKSSPAQQAKLQKLDGFLEPAQRLREAYLENCQRSAIAAVAGASFGPLPTLAAYLAHNPAPPGRVEYLVDQLQALDSGESSLLHPNNQAIPVHQEKLWQSKLTLLEQAETAALAGTPPEIDVQYFEMTSASFMRRLARAAQAGCPIRINIDPSRPQDSKSEVSLDESPRKLRGLLQLLQIPRADVAISLYPVAEELGGPQQLMHRKLLRVGEQVLLGGMNANEGSGENFDTGYLLQGPAARKLVEGFQADLATSAGSTPLQVYGQKLLESFKSGTVGLSPQGLATTLDIITGPSPAGTTIPSKPSLAQLEELAQRADLKLGNLVDLKTLKHRLQYHSGQPLPLKPQGRKLLKQMLTRAFESISQPKNARGLKRLELPQGEASGDFQVAIGSSSPEREALVLQAIASAERFLYVPTFVVTKAMAHAIVARRDQLALQGQELDVKVVADAGVYGFGGTPNELGYLVLEDAGVPVRWALLAGSTPDHDRKIHAKQILSDKMELIGSTNLSNKALRDNWELSGLVYFEANNPLAPATRQDGLSRFEKLWNYESVALDTRAAAKLLETPGLGASESRRKAIRTFLGLISNYRSQSAKWIEDQMAQPGMLERALLLQGQGLAYGYARLQTCKEQLGEEGFFAQLAQLPTRVRLEHFAQGQSPESKTS